MTPFLDTARKGSGFVRALCLAVALWTGVATRATAQAPARSEADVLLDRLVGHWTMNGTVRGEPVEYALAATRVLQGRFIELHMTDAHEPAEYEARVFIGVGGTTGRLVAHWLDSFGAEYSIPAAAGEVRGDTIVLSFPYPERAFRDTFAFDATADRWHFRIEAADANGGWHLFAEYGVTRR